MRRGFIPLIVAILFGVWQGPVALAETPSAEDNSELVEELLKISGAEPVDGGMKLVLEAGQLFKKGSARLKPLAASRLANLASIAAKYRVRDARVEAQGKASLKLLQNQAQSVRRTLVEHGMSPGTLKAKGLAAESGKVVIFIK